MSICNRCMLDLITLRAKKDGKKVAVSPSNRVYVYPPEVPSAELSPAEREPYFAAWLMEIPDKCKC